MDEGHPHEMVDRTKLPEAAQKLGVPSGGPQLLCAWLRTYADRLTSGFYGVSCCRSRTELVDESAGTHSLASVTPVLIHMALLGLSA